MEIIKIISVIFIASQLWACAATHSLKPEYDEESKTLVIDSMTIAPVTYYNEKEATEGYGFGAKHMVKYFKTDVESCPDIVARVLKVDTSVYFLHSNKENILIRYNNSCLTRKIDNIYSLRCLDEVGEKLSMFLTRATSKNAGYGNMITYHLPTNDCLKKFETFFISKTESHNVGEFKSHKPGTPEDVFLKSLVD